MRPCSRPRRRASALAVALILVGLLPLTAPTAARQDIAPVTGHPRLWITADDLPRLRSWATDANPFWRDGLAVLAETAKAAMDAGALPDDDPGDYVAGNSETFAELFAFLSLIHPDEAARNDYAQRARTLLMSMVNEAANGPAEGEPFRDPQFATSGRSRWWGEGFALTVDWIYPTLSAEDKETIRRVFLRWADEIVTTGYPDNLQNLTPDSAQTLDRGLVRWAGNNYFTAGMRNIGLMAMAFDPADDPDGALAAHLEHAIGARLRVVDELLRTDAAGGLAPEGFEYSPQTLSYVTQFLLALHTAGHDDPARWGSQVDWRDNPFWDQMLPAYLHSLSPRPTLIPDFEHLGPVYEPAWYGDGQDYLAPDMIGVFGPLALFDARTGNHERLDAIRWVQTHLPPGGAEELVTERVGDAYVFSDAILYFLLFDPAAPPPGDPRPGLPLSHVASGLGHLFARTSWEEDAAWFTYALGWIGIDHQHADGNEFAFYRNGEWLTKARTGYGDAVGSSPYHNTLGLENDPPGHNEPGDYRRTLWEHGSQWLYGGADGDGRILALSLTPSYVYALGDATDLYNSTYETSTDILHASRAIVWLQPDVIVVYDRATSKTDGRFKRFWLQLPAVPAVDGNRAVVTTATGQQLVVTTLMPANAAITAGPLDPDEPGDEPANGEPMVSWLRVEAPGGPADVRFLHVLQGVDAGAAAEDAVLIASDDGAFAGAVVGTTAVLFPVEVGADVGELTYTVPANTTAHLITGLAPGGRYDATFESDGGTMRVRVAPGASFLADDGGVLAVGLPALTGEGPEGTVSPSPLATVPAAEPTAAPTDLPVATATEAPRTDVTATPATAGGEPLGVELGERDGSGVSGLALLVPEGDRTTATLLVQGATAEQVVLVHRGTCAALDPDPAFLLTGPDATGRGQSALGVALAVLQAEPHAIAIHASARELGTVVACGDIPAG